MAQERELTTGFDPLAALAAVEHTDQAVGRVVARTARMVFEAEARAADLFDQTKLVREVYIGQFLPDLEEASRLAGDIVSGHLATVPFDPDSFGEHGESPESIRTYLEPFVAMDPRAEYEFPKLNFAAAAIMDYKGKEHTVHSLPSSFQPLERWNFSPHYRSDIELPTLFDPQLLTLDELTQKEPTQGAQLREAYQLALEAQGKDKLVFRDPLVVRMVALLPIGADYATDFVPRVGMPEGSDRAWNPYLLVRGGFNEANSCLSTTSPFVRNTIAYNNNGREASLRVRRPEVGNSEANADALMPLAAPELNTLGIMLFPHTVVKKPVQQHTIRLTTDKYREPERIMSSVSSAEVRIGQTGYALADKRDETLFGDKIVPEFGGRPIIYSVRMLTARR